MQPHKDLGKEVLEMVAVGGDGMWAQRALGVTRAKLWHLGRADCEAPVDHAIKNLALKVLWNRQGRSYVFCFRDSYK